MNVLQVEDVLDLSKSYYLAGEGKYTVTLAQILNSRYFPTMTVTKEIYKQLLERYPEKVRQ